MPYVSLDMRPEVVYHYTKRENLSGILHDGRIKKFSDTECWFCLTLEDTLQYMELTVMREGRKYIAHDLLVKTYPSFNPKDYVILELIPTSNYGEWVRWVNAIPPNAAAEMRRDLITCSQLSIGYRLNLRFEPNPQVFELADITS